jgi:tryptophan halogenase
MKSYNFTIVGSGTAGWITALFLSKYYPWANITVISSSDIGILGAGEGTTPHFVDFLNQVDIPLPDIIKYAKGTFKNGIRFSNWNGDERSYFHPFYDGDQLNCFEITDFSKSGTSAIVLDQMINANSIDNCIFSAHASERGLAKLKPNLDLPDPKKVLAQYNSIGSFSFHFDAVLLAKYLKRIAVSRRIRYIDDEVDEILTDENGYITGLKTINKDVYDTNFVFDCSGFKRKIIGQHFNAEWKSYKESLPVNRAIPFFMQHDDTNLKPQTDAIAMKYGWAWKIPVEGRYGCGYVFDDKHITEEQAKQEVLDMFGDNLEFGAKSFTFEAGRYENPWVKNCIAIGLSAGFIEPLEATSIMTSIYALNTFLPNTLGNINKDQFYIDRFNQLVTKYQDDTLDFIYFHYITKRTDTEFWSKFTENNKMPENVKSFLDMCDLTIPDSEFLDKISKVYHTASWHTVGKGLRIIKRDKASEVYSGMMSDIRRENISSLSKSFYINMEVNLSALANHSEILKHVREN